ITPMLAAYFLKGHAHEEKEPGRIMNTYTALVTWSVRHRYLTVIIGLVLFALSVMSIRLLPSGFLPAQDTGRSILAIELPSGSQLSDTDNITQDIVNRLKRRSEVRSVFVDGGRIPPATVEVRKAALTINLVPKNERSISQRQIELDISKELA